MKLHNLNIGMRYISTDNLGNPGEYVVIAQHGKLTESVVLRPPKGSFWKRGTIVFCDSGRDIDLSNQ